MSRARFIEHKGVRIFYIDFSHCPVEEAMDVINDAKPLIRNEPEKSVLTLTYTDGGKFDSEIIATLKEFTRGNEPFVKAAAVVGIKGLQKIVLDAVSFFSNREFATFDDMEKAKEAVITADTETRVQNMCEQIDTVLGTTQADKIGESAGDRGNDREDHKDTMGTTATLTVTESSASLKNTPVEAWPLWILFRKAISG